MAGTVMGGSPEPPATGGDGHREADAPSAVSGAGCAPDPPDAAGAGGRFRFVGAVAGAIRYRFFLLAGALPYLLGAAVAYRSVGAVDWPMLCVGLLGVLSVGTGIEGMNEYFDSRIGGDRVFALPKRVNISWHLPVGLTGFGLALGVAVFLAVVRGWPVLYFALFGAAAALSYLMPPVHLSYRGLGEMVIAAAYGPGLTLGGFWLQTGELSWSALLASMLPAMLILSLAVANEIPDYHGDRLVGKKNLVVRLGRRGGARLYVILTALCFGLMAVGLLCGWYPPFLGLGLLLIPLAASSGLLALRNCERPAGYVRVIRRAILLYVLVNSVAIFSYLAR